MLVIAIIMMVTMGVRISESQDSPGYVCQIPNRGIFYDNKAEPPPMQNIEDWYACCHECTDGGKGHPNEGSCDNACYNTKTKECWLRKYAGGMITMVPGMMCGPNRKPSRSDCTCTFTPEMPGKHWSAVARSGAISTTVPANSTAQCQQFCCDRADYNATSCAYFSFDNSDADQPNRQCTLFTTLNGTAARHTAGWVSGRITAARCPSNTTLPGTEHIVLPYNPYVRRALPSTWRGKHAACRRLQPRAHRRRVPPPSDVFIILPPQMPYQCDMADRAGPGGAGRCVQTVERFRDTPERFSMPNCDNACAAGLRYTCDAASGNCVATDRGGAFPDDTCNLTCAPPPPQGGGGGGSHTSGGGGGGKWTGRGVAAVAVGGAVVTVVVVRLGLFGRRQMKHLGTSVGGPRGGTSVPTIDAPLLAENGPAGSMQAGSGAGE